MNEAETRAKLIDPKLKEVGWDVVEGSDATHRHRRTSSSTPASVAPTSGYVTWSLNVP